MGGAAVLEPHWGVSNGQKLLLVNRFPFFRKKHLECESAGAAPVGAQWGQGCALSAMTTFNIFDTGAPRGVLSQDQVGPHS